MQVQCLSNGQRLTLDAAAMLGAGGEALVYTIPQDRSLVAKVYRTPDKVPARKLAVMVTNPPADPMGSHGHISIAWPVSLLATVDGQQVIGFLMPRVTGRHPLIACYNPAIRRQQWPLFNYRYLLRTAHNLAAAMRALHARGYVIGDVNESNILVTDTALVTLVDTDSFQVREPRHGVVYRCPVGKPEFTPPELQGCPFSQVDRAPEHDLFGLAVLIFQLLMEGTHPFAGVYRGHGDPPPYEARIATGHFPYTRRRQVPYDPKPAAPPFDLLPPTLQELFRRCFETGHTQALARPDASTWQRALQGVEQALIACPANDQHLYSHHLPTCPWCVRTQRLGGRDPFPSRQAVQQSQAPQSSRSLQRPLQPIGTPSPVTPSAPRRTPGHPHPTTGPWHSMRPSPSRALARPSLLASVCLGALWGTVSGVLLSMIVYVLMQRPRVSGPLPVMVWESVQQAGGSAIWGGVWGTMWGMCRRPAGPGHNSRLRRILTGAVLGAVLGLLTSALLGLTPGSTMSMPQHTVLELLGSATWHASLPRIREMFGAFVASLPLHALPGTILGTILGIVWGVWRR
jgi:serine/threonine protein kinase